MKKLLLIIFVKIFEPLTRIGGPTRRMNPTIILIIIGGLAYAGYYYFNQPPEVIPISNGTNINDVQEAIRNGASIDHRDWMGRTALHLAVRYDTIDVIKTLLENKASPSLQDYRGRTALHIERFDKKDNYEIIKLLLEYGVDATIKDSKGQTALDLARARRQSQRKIDLLYKAMDKE